MPVTSYELFRSAIDRSSALELTGIIALATERLQSLTNVTPVLIGKPSARETKSVAAKGVEVCIYLAGSPGLKERAQEVGTSFCKIGTTSRQDAQLRVDDLSRIRYGGHDPATGGHRYGFDDYKLVPFRCPPEPLPPAVRLKEGCLWVRLTNTMSRGTFESRFRLRMREYAVERWATTPQGAEQLALRGLTDASLPVATRFPHGVVRAKELYCLPLGRATTVTARAAADAAGAFR